MVRGFGEMAPLPHIMSWYRDQGFTVETVPFSLVNSLDVTAHAQDLTYRARALADRYGTMINLIGFSLGGVASLYALKRLALNAEVRNFVAYGSPFLGTSLATLAQFVPPTAALSTQATRDSRFLAELRAYPPPRGVTCVSIGGTRDLIVPAGDTLLPWARCLNMRKSHTDFLLSYAVHRMIASCLE